MRVLPQALRRIRQERAISQEALAARCGLSRKTVQRLERGEPARAETLAFVAAALGVAVTEFCESAGRDDRGHTHRYLALKRVRSGKQVFQQLAQTDVGRVECDVDVDGRTLGPLTALVSQLEGLVRDRWDVPRPTVAALPVLAKLQVIAQLNDRLAELQAQGVGLYMGHYYRFAAVQAGAGWPADPGERRSALMLTRLLVSRCGRARVSVAIDQEWRGAPDGTGALGGLSGLLPPAGEAVVVLYPEPPLPAAGDPGPEHLEGEYRLVRG